MAYEYAVEERIYEDGLPPEPNDFWKRPTEILHHPVTQAVAEASPDGRWRIVSIHGRDMTGWQGFADYIPASDYGKGKPLPDAAGQPLAAHDFVMTTIRGYIELHLAEVIRFTPKKVVVKYLNSEYSKFPSEVIKVDKGLFA